MCTGSTKNWIAVEGATSYSSFYANTTTNTTTSNGSNGNYKIASSAPRGPQTYEERNVFAIYVSYYIKVKLILSGMGGEVSLKLPFILGYVDDDSTNISNNDDTDQKTNETKLIEPNASNVDEVVGTQCESGVAATKIENLITVVTNQKETNPLPEQKHRTTTNEAFDDIVAATTHDDTSLAGKLKEKIQFTDDMGSQDIEDNGKLPNLVTAQIHHQLSEQSNEEIAHET